MILTIIGGVTLAIWLVLIFARGGFWLARERDTRDVPPLPEQWPEVVAVVPARDEAEVIAESIGSLLAQDYRGRFRVILVDDSSSDGTAEIARALRVSSRPSPSGEGLGVGRLNLIETSASVDGPHPNPSPEGEGLVLEVMRGAPLAPGWTGKLWAVSQGVERAGDAARYLWLTDADIAHNPDTLTSLVARAEARGLAMVSLMAKLRCESMAERGLIPAFVFFFQILYPFRWVNRPDGVGAAAGGCMLVRREALAAAGGIAAIRTALIDDCALGAALKRQGPIWLGLTERSRSVRPYETLGSVAAMISRSAYAQLNYNPLMLLGTLVGLALVYGAPPALTLLCHGWPQWLGGAAWVLMALSFQPMLSFYRRPWGWGMSLPGIAAFYAGCTLLSAWQHHRGRGGMWKGRAQAATR
ncbi:MAG: glycosyltransferase [Sphingomonas sp.]|jgi:hopene-associated glycosyltransferase HpnB|uniref:glycosyltransferase n=1 Tax=Sphingomonas sp. TaxID=28214 RepID=UPI0035694269